MNEARLERARLQERAKRLREYEEQQRARAAQDAANLPEERRAEASARGAEQAGTWEPGGGETTEETVYLLRFECQVTRGQAAELAAWLKERNISYRRI